MKQSHDLTGRVFGRLVVYGAVAGARQQEWACICICGEVRSIVTASLLTGAARSCGCLRRVVTSARKKVHGSSKRCAEYRIWRHMKTRCYNSKSKYYHRYGGRGIGVCAHWRESFQNFLADMGRRPSARHSIERKNNDGNYEPENCRRATTKEQAVNRSNNVFVEHTGVRCTLSQWAEMTGLPYRLLHRRYWEGWRGARLFQPRCAA